MPFVASKRRHYEIWRLGDEEILLFVHPYKYLKANIKLDRIIN